MNLEIFPESINKLLVEYNQEKDDYNKCITDFPTHFFNKQKVFREKMQNTAVKIVEEITKKYD